MNLVMFNNLKQRQDSLNIQNENIIHMYDIILRLTWMLFLLPIKWLLVHN